MLGINRVFVLMLLIFRALKCNVYNGIHNMHLIIPDPLAVTRLYSLQSTYIVHTLTLHIANMRRIFVFFFSSHKLVFLCFLFFLLCFRFVLTRCSFNIFLFIFFRFYEIQTKNKKKLINYFYNYLLTCFTNINLNIQLYLSCMDFNINECNVLGLQRTFILIIHNSR